MKIALIAPTYLPSRRANTVQVMKMAQALVGCGQEARVCVPGVDPGVGWEELAEHYGLERRFPIAWLAAHPRLRRYDYGYRAVGWARRWGAELVYTRLPQAAAIASGRGIPTILEVHDLPQGRMGRFLFRRFLRGREARRLVVITHALARDLAAKLGAPEDGTFTLVAADGVDLERYADLPVPEEARRSLDMPNRFTAGYTGHLYPGRGAELMLAIAARLPEVTFLLVGGEPDDVARVRTEAEAAGLDNLVLTGFVLNAELPRYQAACEVLLMPYQRRVAASGGGDIGRYLSPMKLFEYLACGRAVISSDLPVFRETLSEENAVLLPPDEPETWVDALVALQADPEMRATLAARARQTAEAYTWEARAERILEGIKI